jgi:hypothetical protein
MAELSQSVCTFPDLKTGEKAPREDQRNRLRLPQPRRRIFLDAYRFAGQITTACIASPGLRRFQFGCAWFILATAPVRQLQHAAALDN